MLAAKSPLASVLVSSGARTSAAGTTAISTLLIGVATTAELAAATSLTIPLHHSLEGLPLGILLVWLILLWLTSCGIVFDFRF